MANTVNAPRGTRDILPEEQAYWAKLSKIAEKLTTKFGFEKIDTPTFEELVLFTRSIGEGTDVMDKELFVTKGIRVEEGESQYALRPEGTAGIVRAYIEHGMHKLPQPVKLWTYARNFRYDRPQKGRFREHVQFDVEYFTPASAYADAFCIWMSYLFLKEAGLGEGIRCKVNTLGTTEERLSFIQALREHIAHNSLKLSEDSLRRLEINPLRILDSKDQADQRALDEFSSLFDHLSEASQTYFRQVCEHLDAWQVPYEHDTRLVRGLDYYSHTAFEWVITDNAGQQGSIGGGGRYDGLISQLGGPAEVGGIGFGLGMDRIVVEMMHRGVTLDDAPRKVALIVPDGTPVAVYTVKLAELATREGWQVECEPDRSVNSQKKRAERLGCEEIIEL